MPVIQREVIGIQIWVVTSCNSISWWFSSPTSTSAQPPCDAFAKCLTPGILLAQQGPRSVHANGLISWDLLELLRKQQELVPSSHHLPGFWGVFLMHLASQCFQKMFCKHEGCGQCNHTMKQVPGGAQGKTAPSHHCNCWDTLSAALLATPDHTFCWQWLNFQYQCSFPGNADLGLVPLLQCPTARWEGTELLLREEKRWQGIGF